MNDDSYRNVLIQNHRKVIWHLERYQATHKLSEMEQREIRRKIMVQELALLEFESERAGTSI